MVVAPLSQPFNRGDKGRIKRLVTAKHQSAVPFSSR